MAYQWWHEPEFREQSDDITAAINNYATQAQKVGGAFLNSGKTNGGEVYTPYWTIVKMCYLITEINDLNKTVLDACCGSGNFILEVYRRRFIVAAHSNNVYENIKNIVRNSFALDINSNSIYKARQRINTLFSNITTCFVLHNLLTEQQKNELDTYITENIHYSVAADSLYSVPCKFDVIISNPPYNKDMYLDFVEAAYDLLNEDGIGVFITPAKFYAKGGAKNEAFRQKIMPHIKEVHLYKCCTDIFDIAEQGGVAYYDLYKSQTFDTKEIYNHNKNASLDDTRLDTHTHTEQHVEFMPLSCLHILDKIKQLNNGHTLLENFDLIDSYYCGQNDYADSSSPCENHYPFYSGVGGKLSLAGYINKNKLKRTTNIEKYKVFMAQNMFTGVGNDSNGYLPYTKLCQILGPNEIPKGHAYIILHFADSEVEAKSFCAYVNSQLVSFIAMLTVLGNGTGHVENWRHVPAFPATYPVDVHTKYVDKKAGEPCEFDHIYTNEEIFDIFQLTEDERKLITSVIKPRAKKGI